MAVNAVHASPAIPTARALPTAAGAAKGKLPFSQQFPVSGEGIWRVGIIVASSAGVS